MERRGVPGKLVRSLAAPGADQRLSRNHRQSVSGSLRSVVHPGHQFQPGVDQEPGAGDHREGLRVRLGGAPSSGAREWAAGRRDRLGPRRAGRRAKFAAPWSSGGPVRAGPENRRAPALRNPGFQARQVGPRATTCPDGRRRGGVRDRRGDRPRPVRALPAAQVRRPTAGPGGRAAPGPPGAWAGIQRYSLRHGLSEPVQQVGLRGASARGHSAGGEDLGTGQAGAGDRRRRHGGGLCRNGRASGSPLRDPDRDPAPAAGLGAVQQPPVALLAEPPADHQLP